MDWLERQEAIRELVAYPEQDFLGELEKGIRNHDDADIRNAAMEAYKALGLRGFTSLESLLQDTDHEVRLFAVNILCDVAEPGGFPLLVKAIQDPDVNVRVAAAEALGKIGEVLAVPVLANSFHDEPWVAMAAVNALGELGGEEALEALYGCLEIIGCQEIAINAIGNAGDLNSVRHLADCLRHDHLAELALKAIVKISERKQVSPQPEHFVQHFPKLIEMLQATDPETRKAAIITISCTTNVSDRQFLKLLAETTPEFRTNVALVLGSRNLPQAVQLLQTLLNDPAEEVRMTARESLVKLGEAS